MATVTPEEALVERVSELTERLEEIADPEARALADELASAIVQLYGEGIRRIFTALGAPDATVESVREQAAMDGVVASLMLIHDLYPVDLEGRVREALDSVRPYMESHGGDVELLGIADGMAQLRLSGHCKGCAASQSTLELVIEQALREHAPDLRGMLVEGVVEPAAAPVAPMEGERRWVALDEAASLARGAVMPAGDELVVANVAGTLLVYRDRCAGCGATLSDGVLLGGELACNGCRRRFHLPRAGRCVDDDSLQLEPVPLLRKGGRLRVAVSG